MITEDYVSFETAKLLKEKGFDEICYTAYETITNAHEVEECSISSWGKLGQVKRPTLQMAMKWLREEHNIFIDILSRFSKNADKDVCFSYSCKKLIDTYKSSYEYSDGEWFNYEEACEAVIKYCLENLI